MVAEGVEGIVQGGEELPIPLQHRRLTSMDLARGEWISFLLHISRRGGGEGCWICDRWRLPVGEDDGRWFAAAGMRSTEGVRTGAERGVRELILFF